MGEATTFAKVEKHYKIQIRFVLKKAFLHKEMMHLCDCVLILSSLHKAMFGWWYFTVNCRTHFHLTDTSAAVKCKSLSSSPMNYELSVSLFFHKYIIWSAFQMCHMRCRGFPVQDISHIQASHSQKWSIHFQLREIAHMASLWHLHSHTQSQAIHMLSIHSANHWAQFTIYIYI